MLNAKILLSVLVIMTIVATVLAFKANHYTAHTFYRFGTSTTTVGGPSVTGCVVPTFLFDCTTVFFGQPLIGYSTTTFITSDSFQCTVVVTPCDNE